MLEFGPSICRSPLIRCRRKIENQTLTRKSKRTDLYFHDWKLAKKDQKVKDCIMEFEIVKQKVIK